ncbi:hypothetical protein [Bradyrhizobium jicamae]|uniref:hypothetical protein n=1 Tax=Bradyrhizobium jicamae TaxID=280332 RepID=UPI001BABD2BA|nr:hypothetical protein [Bradyrhizobium jicamae]MBR0933416.1 hypothetical protein [Bradyrhizobium jicamae]
MRTPVIVFAAVSIAIDAFLHPPDFLVGQPVPTPESADEKRYAGDQDNQDDYGDGEKAAHDAPIVHWRDFPAFAQVNPVLDTIPEG